MSQGLCQTFRELAHLTWGRLELAQQVGLSWSEESNTETVLLALKARHPQHIRIQAFTKKQEALNGSDWEWWIGSPGRWFGMRVQAKRIHRAKASFHALRRQRPKGHSATQMQTLIATAVTDGLTPAYCFYVYAPQWSRISHRPAPWLNASRLTLAGCLIGHAAAVEATGSESLSKIAPVCFPWHWLVCEPEAADEDVSSADRAHTLLRLSASAAGHFHEVTSPPRQTLPTYLTHSIALGIADYRDDGAAAERAISRNLAGFVVVNTDAEARWT